MKNSLNGTKLLTFDYDGTLSHDFQLPSERTKSALRLAHQKGCTLVLATGRSLSVVPADVLSLPFSYFITSNGARTLDGSNHKVIQNSTIDKNLVLQVLESMDMDKAAFNIYINEKPVVLAPNRNVPWKTK